LAAASRTRWGPFVTFAFATGMRRGEICALQWSDVDLERGIASVMRSLSETRDGAVLKGTKTGRGRTVPLSRMAIDALRRQKALQAADRLANGPAYEPDPAGPVFTNEIGLRIGAMDATKAYGRIAKSAGISSLRLHDARHTAATHLLVAGVDVRSVSGILGHASATTTLSTYAHLVVDAQRDAVEKLGDRLELMTDGNRMATAEGSTARKLP
jgi:integrase